MTQGMAAGMTHLCSCDGLYHKVAEVSSAARKGQPTCTGPLQASAVVTPTNVPAAEPRVRVGPDGIKA